MPGKREFNLIVHQTRKAIAQLADEKIGDTSLDDYAEQHHTELGFENSATCKRYLAVVKRAASYNSGTRGKQFSISELERLARLFKIWEIPAEDSLVEQVRDAINGSYRLKFDYPVTSKRTLLAIYLSRETSHQ